MVNHLLSDLFFNYEEQEDFSQENLVKAARKFLDTYSEILSCTIPTAEQLAEDFTNRV